MSKEMSKWLHISLSVLLGFSLTGCDKISIPRLSFEEKPKTKAPIAINYRFGPALSQHTHVVDACGFPHTIKSGEIITNTFLEVGQDHFTSATAAQPLSSTQPPSGSSRPLTVDLQLIQFNLEPIGRFGEEDRFHANVELELRAVYQDAQGHPIAQTPLTYTEKASLWIPALTSQTTSCATGQFDEVVENAAETLATDMVNVIPQLYGQAPQLTPQGSDDHAGNIPPTAIPEHKPSLSFRTKLQDSNDNLILEGGENVVLQVETTNTNSTPLPSAYIELRGTQAIINAFSKVTTLPIPIGSLQGGEKKVTEVRGRMPAAVKEEKGELVVSISVSQGIPPGAHTILAAIQPGASTPQAAVSSQEFKQGQTEEDRKIRGTSPSEESPYYALVVGLDTYRDPWPKAHHISQQYVQDIANTLQATGTFPHDHITVLNGSHATRTDVEETLFGLAKHEFTAESIFLMYFAGHALIDPTKGDVYLVPYEGSLSASKKRLISLRSLHRVLGKLKVKLSLLFLDTPVMQYLGNGEDVVGLNGSTPGNWGAAIPVKNLDSQPPILQVRRVDGTSLSEPDQLLAGLRGSADLDQNGTVTLGEFFQDMASNVEILPPPSKNFIHSDLLLVR